MSSRTSISTNLYMKIRPKICPFSLIEKFVKMYVNKVTVSMGESGEKAIRKLFEMAWKKNLVPK